MDGVSTVANRFGSSSTHHQTKQVRPTRDHAEKDVKIAATPSTKIGMEARELISKRRSVDHPDIVLTKPIRIKLRQQDQEREDLLQRVH